MKYKLDKKGLNEVEKISKYAGLLCSLKGELEVKLPYRAVNKAEIEKHGILQAYKDTPVTLRKITFN